MADNSNKNLAIGLFIGAAILGGYAVLGGDSNTDAGLQPVPPNGMINSQWGQWQNTTGAPVWVNATGQIISAAGNVLGSVADILAALNQGNSGGGGSGLPNSSTGTWVDNGQGSMEWEPYTAGVGSSGYYYNPQPGGLM